MVSTTRTPSRKEPGFAAAAATLAMCCSVAAAATIKEFPLASDHAAPTAIVGASDGNLWFTEFTNAKIGRITPQGQITEYSTVGLPNDNPVAITALGADVWFLKSNTVGKITTAGAVTQYALPYAYGSNAQGIAAGPDGNLWFTESRCAHCDPNAPGQIPNDGATIGRITPQGVITEFTLSDYHAGPRGITAGPDGALWFTESVGNKIGRITTSGTVTEFALPVARSNPQGITAGSDGNLWFVESRCTTNCEFGNSSGIEVIGRITPAGVITEFTTGGGIGGGNGIGTIGIAEAADHNLWFTEPANNRVGRITHAGAIQEFDVLTPRPADFPSGLPYLTAPMGIAGGPDGNVWFVEAQLGSGGRVGKVDLATTTGPAPLVIGPGFTGNWSNAAQSGHGFSIEVLPANQLLAQWYVFGPNGGQAWIIGTGAIVGNTATLDAFQALGAGGLFPPQFDATRVAPQPWGKITFTFSDCNNGQVSWQPTAAGYTAGAMAITRLTLPAGLSCQ